MKNIANIITASIKSRPVCIVFVTVTLFLLFTLFQNHKITAIRDLYNMQAVELSTLKDSVQRVVHKNGQLSFKITAAEVEKKSLKDALEIAGYDISSLREREIQYRKINSVLRARLEAAGEIKTTVHDTFRIVESDTIRYQYIKDISNGHLSVFDARIENQFLDFSYRYKVGLDFFLTNEKNKTIVTVLLSDPNAEITSASSITVTHKRKFYQKPWVWAVVGFTSGLLISK